MSDKQSILYEAYREASQRFDYFMISLAGALFAYVGQSWRPAPLTFSSGTLELAAILLFAASVGAGLKRRQYVVSSLKVNHGILEAEERHSQLMSGSQGRGMVQLASGEVLSPEQASDLLEAVSKQLPELRNTFKNIDDSASLAYITQNWLLVLGMLALAASKVLAAYALAPF